MKLFAISAFAVASLAASSALAQTQGPANPGPVIPGVCVYFNQQALAQSTVGQAVQARMEQLAQEVQGEIAPYATQLQTEYQALQQGASTMPAEHTPRVPSSWSVASRGSDGEDTICQWRSRTRRHSNRSRSGTTPLSAPAARPIGSSLG